VFEQRMFSLGIGFTVYLFVLSSSYYRYFIFNLIASAGAQTRYAIGIFRAHAKEIMTISSNEHSEISVESHPYIIIIVIAQGPQ